MVVLPLFCPTGLDGRYELPDDGVADGRVLLLLPLLFIDGEPPCGRFVPGVLFAGTRR